MSYIYYILFEVNYYEMTYFQHKFLDMWSTYKSHTYIEAKSFIKLLNINYVTVFRNFFSIYGINVIIYL